MGYFTSRRLIRMMEDNLVPLGYAFLEWSIHGDETSGPVYRYVFLTPDGKKQVETGVLVRELQQGEHPLRTVAGVLSNRIVKSVERDAKSPPPPSP